MDQKTFAIVSAICRSSMAHPNNAIIHHIKRLMNELEKTGFKDQADSLRKIIEPDKDCPIVIPILSTEP